MAMASSSSNHAPTGRWTYDVFLSFRGEDTRNSFVDHLYSALDQAGIYTFKDDEKLQRGKSISPELTKAIQESMVAVVVVVFSKNYANSSWCLEELAKIIDCRDLMGQMVLPVFYDVDPSDFRGQKRSFHAAFEQYEVKLIDNMDKVKRWREALVTTANLSGWDVPKTASGREAECIRQIVRNILSYTQSRPTGNLIGMESRVRHVKSLLGKATDDVRIIGICGMGGIGKTTIARAVYHQISYEFDGSCFLEEVRENGSDKGGLKSLQEKLLKEILMQEHFHVKDCDDGIFQIRRRLSRKKFLVVLDDVDNFKQLEFLAGAHEWFGPGSRILVTTRDEHLLCYVQDKYAPELLKETEAMKLFSRYAFKANIPPNAYKELSGVVVSYTGHLPLALKVLGSHFSGRNSKFWQSALNVLTKIPHKEINGILKLSYDGLNILEKKIFLHIACFFKGRERANVTRVLDSFGLEPESGITVLIERSLLTISNGLLHMHDLIQKMGRCVVRECYPNNMIWDLEEIKEVMTTTSISETVKAVVDTTHYHFSVMPMACCSAQVFKSMKKLWLLEVKGKFTSSEPVYFPEQLRWFCWYMYPFKSLRITTGMTELVGLELQSGRMKQLHMEKKVILPNLKYMDLSFSFSITSFPDISGVPNLERLNLSFCSDLVEIHKFVLLHERIVHLYLSSCDSLKTLPSPIQMKSLQTLHLNGCNNLKRFPEVSRDMHNLLVLNINGCDRITLPTSIVCFTRLVILTMGKYSGMELDTDFEEYNSSIVRTKNLISIQGSAYLRSLRLLDLKHNYLVESDFPDDVHEKWPLLEKLDLSMNEFTHLFTGVSKLSHLRYLNLSYCNFLKELDKLPSLIQVLRADRCTSLEKVGDLSNKYKWLFKISLRHCPKLLKDEESESHVANLLKKSLVQKCAAVNRQLSITVPGYKIPNWFPRRWLGDKMALNLPQSQITKMIGLAICVVYPLGNISRLKIKFKSSVDDKLIGMPSYVVERADHVWMGYMPIDSLQNLCHGFNYEDIVISFESDDRSIECGMCVIYEDDVEPMTGTELWIPDHMELGWNDHEGVCGEELLHGRWPKSSFLSRDEETEHSNTKHEVHHHHSTCESQTTYLAYHLHSVAHIIDQHVLMAALQKLSKNPLKLSSVFLVQELDHESQIMMNWVELTSTVHVTRTCSMEDGPSRHFLLIMKKLETSRLT